MTSSLYLHWAYGWRIFTWFDDLDDYDAQYDFMVILWWFYDDYDDFMMMMMIFSTSTVAEVLSFAATAESMVAFTGP